MKLTIRIWKDGGRRDLWAEATHKDFIGQMGLKMDLDGGEVWFGLSFEKKAEEEHGQNRCVMGRVRTSSRLSWMALLQKESEISLEKRV